MVTREHGEKQESTDVKAPLSAADAILAARKAQHNIADNATVEVDERGFTRVFDKKGLLGKPFTIIDWEDNVEEFGWTATIHIVQGKNALFFKDGSTGVYEQLKALKAKGIETMISCPRGLRVSEYDNPHGEGRSRTYYLDDSTI